MKKTGFTLAETLITLGIIGIVAAITLPTLITKLSNDRNSTILKEDYSILQQMMKSANYAGAIENKVGENNLEDLEKWFETYMLPYIKTSNVCYDEWGCWNKNVLNSNGTKFIESGQCGYHSISFVLNNGSYVCMDDVGLNNSKYGVSSADNMLVLVIDVNGDKKPNMFGKDIFAVVYKDEQLIPAGYDMGKDKINQNCSETCSGNFCGTYCMVKVQRQGFKLPVLGKK